MIFPSIHLFQAIFITLEDYHEYLRHNEHSRVFRKRALYMKNLNFFNLFLYLLCKEIKAMAFNQKCDL